MIGGGPAFDLVIFDLDGTLVDSLPDIAWALNTTLVGAGLPPFPVETVRGFVGDGAGMLIERALSTAGQASPPDRPSTRQGESSATPALPSHQVLLDRFMTAYGARVCADSRLYSGIAELLTALAALNVAMAVVTNKPGQLARQLLHTLGIASHFRAIVGDRDGFPRKPDPAAARSVMQAVGVAPDRTVVVGDGLPDMRMAHAAGCHAIAAGWGYMPLSQLQAERPAHLATSPETAGRLLVPGFAPHTHITV